MENSILIVDDDTAVIAAIKRSLMEEPYVVYTANSGMEGLDLLKMHKIKLVISDEKMPGMTGTEFLSTVKNMFPETVRIMLTGYASIQAAMKAVNSGEIYRFFSKPWEDIELKLSIRSAIERYDLEEENRILLATVKSQASELKQLEKMHPGITSLKKDREGNLILPDISEDDEELSDILKQSGINGLKKT
ncbi:MAG: response regulator [Nitrospiraceae bacterium]|nr:MAG: response regulator [Nitrospiraceae bacterium]